MSSPFNFTTDSTWPLSVFSSRSLKQWGKSFYENMLIGGVCKWNGFQRHHLLITLRSRHVSWLVRRSRRVLCSCSFRRRCCSTREVEVHVMSFEQEPIELLFLLFHSLSCWWKQSVAQNIVYKFTTNLNFCSFILSKDWLDNNKENEKERCTLFCSKLFHAFPLKMYRMANFMISSGI